MQEGIGQIYERLQEIDPSGEHYVGACFFHSQDMDGAVCGEGLLLAFTHLESEADEDDVAIGRRVVEALRQRGLTVAWDGTHRRRIALPAFRWQRRTPD